MTDYIATGRVVPERIAAIVKGIAEALRRGRLRAGRRRDRRAPRPARSPTSTTSPARPPAWSRPTTCSAPAGSGPATSWSRWRRSGLHSNGYSLVRHVLLGPKAGLGAGPRRRRARAARSARSCSSRPGSTPRPAWPRRRATGTHAMSHVTGGGLAANLARVLPVELRRDHRPRDLDAAAGLRPGPPGRRRSPARPRGDPQLRRRHGRADSTPTTSTPRSRCSPSTASGPGSPARSPRPTATAAGRVELVGPAPRLVMFRRYGPESLAVCGNSHATGSVGPTRN